MSAIRELIEAVEAGCEVRVGMVRPVFPEPAHMDLVFIALRPNDIRAEGAALALMATVLPGWIVHSIGQRHGGVWEAHLLALNADGGHDNLTDPDADGWADTPARALLLAILKAMEARQ